MLLSMAANVSGSSISYDVHVGSKGQILLSWLKSRYYNLGEARIKLDGLKPGVKVSGHWE